MKRKIYFVSAVAVATLFSSCASFENLTDDRTRLEDDELYWNRKEMFFDPNQYPVTNKSASNDDYYNPNSSANYSNQYSGARNPVASFNPLSGWQMSYGLSTFNNYFPSVGSGMMYGMSNGFNNGFGYGSGFGSGFYPGYGMGMGNQYGYGYGMNNYYNPYGGGYYGSYSPFYSGYYGSSFYNPFYYGHNNWNSTGGSTGSGADAPHVTHLHHTAPMVGSANNSSYHNGVLRKNVVQPVTVASRNPVEPARSIPGVRPPSNQVSRMPSNTSRPDVNNDYYSGGSRGNGGNAGNGGMYNNSPSRAQDHSPSYSSPSRETPSRGSSSPSYNSPSPARSTPSYSSPSPSHSSPSRSTPSHSSSPGRR